MTPQSFKTWLDSVQISAPFTLVDAQALYGIIHSAFAGAPRRPIVDVYALHDGKVRIRVVTPNDVVIERAIDVG